jgi:hypothetical protein
MADGVDLHGISQAAFDLIVEFEVSSEVAYTRATGARHGPVALQA